jgi:hypothetical protein
VPASTPLRWPPDAKTTKMKDGRTWRTTPSMRGIRRVHLRGHANIRKRLLIHAGGFNLGRLLRQLIGVGTPRGLQGRLIAVLATRLALRRDPWKRVTPHRDLGRRISPLEAPRDRGIPVVQIAAREMLFTTGGYGPHLRWCTQGSHALHELFVEFLRWRYTSSAGFA